MKIFFNKFIHIGIDEDTPTDERIKIKGVNSISLALIPALLFIIILESINPRGTPSFVAMMTLYLALVSFILYLNIKGRFRLAHNLILFVAPFGIFAEIVLFGNSFRADTLFISVFVAGIFLQPYNKGYFT